MLTPQAHRIGPRSKPWHGDGGTGVRWAFIKVRTDDGTIRRTGLCQTAHFPGVMPVMMGAYGPHDCEINDGTEQVRDGK